MNTTSQRPGQILQTVFGYPQFKPLQEEIITNVLARKDSLVIMPTGGGKSLCYQIPALIFDGLTIVVSPLISLMKDQVQQLNQLGVQAALLNSSLSFEEYNQNVERLLNGQANLLYIAPESLLTARVSAILAGMQIDCLTIDEAHCISEWGHDFRPEYRQLIDVRKRFPEAVCIALTATATSRVRQDIKASLGFSSSNEFVASFDRPNLYLEVAPKTNPGRQLLRFLRRFPGQPGIIYCFSRKQVDELTASLVEKGFSARAYHAGLSAEERETSQDMFLRDDAQIIVATIAFGMGINKSNVRFVVHFDLPKSIESYYQEIGRAGRDGLPSYCLLLFNYGDLKKQEYFIEQKEWSEQQIARQHLDALVQYANSRTCRRVPLLQYFGEKYTIANCNMCDHCRTLDENVVDITTPALKFLSCVARTGENFGAGHVTDVLLGSKNQKVQSHGHERLSTYGIGKDLSREQWLHLCNQLLQKGYLTQDVEFQSLRLTQEAYQFFKTRTPLMGALVEAPERDGPRGVEEYDRELFDLLRARRKELADAARVPPYVIFSDRTLADMAMRYPVNVERMDRIYGVGARKLEQYGQEFADIVASYCQQHNIQPPTVPAVPAKASSSSTLSVESSARHLATGQAYQNGMGMRALVARFGVKPDTIINHLARCLLEGMLFPPRDDLLEDVQANAELRQKALAAFREQGTAYLKPVFDVLDGQVDYDDLKALRLYAIMHKMQA